MRKDRTFIPMTEHCDAIGQLEEYLDFLCDDAGVGREAVTDQDIGAAVLPHFGSQLIAIRSVLERNQEAEDRVAAEIERIETEIRARGAGSWMESERISQRHSSTFLDAAHSMAAVGLITPLIESLFDEAFRYLKHAIGKSYSLGSGHEQWQLDDRWDRGFLWKHGRRSGGIAKAIVQLAEAIDLKQHLPADLARTLSVLFKYRNKMFHCGLEWPEKDVADFANLIASRGWTNCFRSAESGGDPWIFYLSREFTDHCLETVDEVINGVGARVRRELWSRRNPWI